MSRSYKSLQDAVLDHQLNRTKYLGSVKRWLNEGQDALAQAVSFRALFTPIDFETVVGEDAYNLPDDFLRLVENGVGNASDPNDWLIFERLELRDFDEMPEMDGTPTAYVIAGNVLYLYPRPDAVYDIALIYYRRPQAMADDSDTMDISDINDDLLEYYALRRAYERENDYQAAQYWAAMFDKGLNEARAYNHYDTHDGPELVGGTWEDLQRVGRAGGGSGTGGTTTTTVPPVDTGNGGTGGDGTFGSGTFGG